jgi:hypothetical protein
MRNPQESYQKEPIALLWIIIGLLGVVGTCILIERFVVRY